MNNESESYQWDEEGGLITDWNPDGIPIRGSSHNIFDQGQDSYESNDRGWHSYGHGHNIFDGFHDGSSNNRHAGLSGGHDLHNLHEHHEFQDLPIPRSETRFGSRQELRGFNDGLTELSVDWSEKETPIRTGLRVENEILEASSNTVLPSSTAEATATMMSVAPRSNSYGFVTGFSVRSKENQGVLPHNVQQREPWMVDNYTEVDEERGLITDWNPDGISIRGGGHDLHNLHEHHEFQDLPMPRSETRFGSRQGLRGFNDGLTELSVDWSEKETPIRTGLRVENEILEARSNTVLPNSTAKATATMMSVAPRSNSYGFVTGFSGRSTENQGVLPHNGQQRQPLMVDNYAEVDEERGLITDWNPDGISIRGGGHDLHNLHEHHEFQDLPIPRSETRFGNRQGLRGFNDGLTELSVDWSEKGTPIRTGLRVENEILAARGNTALPSSRAEATATMMSVVPRSNSYGFVTGFSGRSTENQGVLPHNVQQREPWMVDNCAEVNAIARGAGRTPEALYTFRGYSHRKMGQVEPPCQNCEQHVGEAAISNDTMVNFSRIKTSVPRYRN